MCIAVYKPMGVDFPSKRVLKRCFYANPDGAGFMVAGGNNVEIHKGYMGFRSFWKALRGVRERYGDEKAYVMHFRISTQGGVRPDGCHPFPLSRDMDDLRMLHAYADIGIAHNGIIDLCTDYGSLYYSYKSYRYGYKSNEVDYSDTMKFITEYLSLIIKDKSYYTDVDTLRLIDKLCGSRLAILDATGHCELIGSGWEACDGVWYSNDSYKERKTTMVTTAHSYPSTIKDDDDDDDDVPVYKAKYDGYYDDDDIVYDADGYPVGFKSIYDPYGEYLGEDGIYDFSQSDCPATLDGDDSYCYYCNQYNQCWNYDDKDVDTEESAYEIVSNAVKVS